jgi:hypothetical protein
LEKDYEGIDNFLLQEKMFGKIDVAHFFLPILRMDVNN